MKKKVKVRLHGECMAYPCKLPKNCKAIQPTTSEYMIVADSETTGNHHVVDVNESVQFFMDDDGGMYMKNEASTNIRCVHAERHDAIELPADTWKFKSQQEYDYFTLQLRKVAD